MKLDVLDMGVDSLNVPKYGRSTSSLGNMLESSLPHYQFMFSFLLSSLKQLSFNLKPFAPCPVVAGPINVLINHSGFERGHIQALGDFLEQLVVKSISTVSVRREIFQNSLCFVQRQ